MRTILESFAAGIAPVHVFENQHPEIPVKFALSQAREEKVEHPRRESVLPKTAFVQHWFTAAVP